MGVERNSWHGSRPDGPCGADPEVVAEVWVVERVFEFDWIGF
jgi:hypothetical protein